MVLHGLTMSVIFCYCHAGANFVDVVVRVVSYTAALFCNFLLATCMNCFSMCDILSSFNVVMALSTPEFL